MPLQQIPKVTQEQIRSKGVESLADRPNQMSVYGQGGLSARELKLKFDALSSFLAQKINDLIDAQGSDDAADFIKVPISEEYQTLGDFIRAFLNGGAAEDLIRVYTKKPQLVDLTGAVVDFNEELNPVQAGTSGSFNVNIDVDDTTYMIASISISPNEGFYSNGGGAYHYFYEYGQWHIRRDGWVFLGGEDVTNPDLIEWVLANGTVVSGGVYDYDAETDTETLTSLQEAIDLLFSRLATKYAKPSAGIPKTDLSDSVQESLSLADSALQNESDPTVPAWAKEPQKPSYSASEITDGQTNVASEIAGINGKIPSSATSQNKLATASDVSAAVGTETTRATGKESELQSQIDAIVSATDVRDVVGTYSELLVYDTSTLGDNDIVKVLNDTTHSGARSYYRWLISGNSGIWNYIGSEAISYTKTEEDALLAGKQNTITDLAEIRNGAAAGATAYQKPSAGIPAGDLASAVKTSLDKADSALQEHQSLAAYRTASAQDMIDNGKQPTISDLETIRSGASLGANSIQKGQDRMRHVYHQVTTEPLEKIKITTDNDGNPFSLRRMYAKVTLPERSGTYSLGTLVYVSGGTLHSNYDNVGTSTFASFNHNIANGAKVFITYYLEIDKDYEPVVTQSYLAASGQQGYHMNRYFYDWWDPRSPISAFCISGVTNGFDAGTVIDIYGEDY